MIPTQLILPTIEAIVNTVILVENLFNQDKSLDKKKDALERSGKSVYKIWDIVFGFDDEVDQWANQMITKAVDAAVEWFNDHNERNFNESKKASVVAFVNVKLKEDGLFEEVA